MVIQYLNIQYLSLFNSIIQSNPQQFFLQFFQAIFLIGQLFLSGLLLIRNNKDRQTVLITFTILAIIAHYLVYQEHMIIRYFFYIILFFLLLKRTSWTEKLDKKALGIYSLFLILFLVLFLSETVFDRHWQEVFKESSLWHTFPRFFHDILLVYLTTLTIKIPAVIIYNHLSLSRKLWFAGLLQSTIPQIFQTILLLVIFYLFISGWQASQLKDNLLSSITQSTLNDGAPKNISDEFKTIINKKYDSEENLTFTISQFDSSEKLIFSKDISSEFCKELWDESTFIFGNGIIAYPFKKREWEESLNKIDLWQKERSVTIYPFSLFPASDSINTGYYDLSDSVNTMAAIKFDIQGYFLNFGRIILLVSTDKMGNLSYFSFDIVLNYKNVSVSDPMVGILLFILLMFFIINGLIIRRVVRAGEKINQTIISKFDRLKSGIREISGGNLNYQVTMEGEDEFVELADRFNDMSSKLHQTLEEVREKDRLDEELKIARNVQLSLLPQEIPEIDGYEIAADLETANEVSGDFYDIVLHSPGKYLFTIGDVSGKGSSAAFYMAQFISLFRFSAQFTDFPREIALRINEYFTQHIRDKHIFITAIIGLLNTNNDTITFVRAGHTIPLYLNNKENDIQEIKTNGIGIGLTKSSESIKKSTEKHSFSLNDNDSIFFYTDGLVEASRSFQGFEEQFEEERLVNILRKNINENAQNILKNIFEELNQFYGNEPKHDDVSILIIKKKKKE